MRKELQTAACFSVILGIILFAQPIVGEQREDPERGRIFEEVKGLLRESDTFRAIEFVHGQGDPQAVVKRYLDLVMDFYWKEQALPEVITLARSGIQYSLTKAQEIVEGDSEKALQLRSVAKAIAYNLASFTWPGWDEKGIDISEADMAVGLDAAKLNLRLAYELKKGTMPVSNAYWGLGAQYLAAEEYDAAVEAFALAKGKAKEARDRGCELMNLGYIGITRIVEGSQKTEGEEELDEAMGELEKLGTEDAEFYISQLKIALKVFSE